MRLAALLLIAACGESGVASLDAAVDEPVEICADAAPEDRLLLIDPETGACTDRSRNPCLRIPEPPDPPCESACTPLDEAACRDDSGCHAVYAGEPAVFAACWALAGYDSADTPTCGELQSGGECASFRYCRSIRTSLPGPFLVCLDELK